MVKVALSTLLANATWHVARYFAPLRDTSMEARHDEGILVNSPWPLN